MKRASISLLLLLFVALLFACMGPQGTETDSGDGSDSEEVDEVKIIDHKNKGLGGDVPAWCFASTFDLETQSDFEDSYVFKIEENGQSLDGLKAWASGFSVPTEIARFVSTRVMNKFVGAQVGDKDMVESYMENVTKSLAQAQFSGARKRDDYWVKKREGEETYFTYLLLVTAPRDLIDDAIDQALSAESERSKPKTEEEKVARDRVQALFKDEGISGSE
jgi:hypothetical protein